MLIKRRMRIEKISCLIKHFKHIQIDVFQSSSVEATSNKNANQDNLGGSYSFFNRYIFSCINFHSIVYCIIN